MGNNDGVFVVANISVRVQEDVGIRERIKLYMQ